MNTYWLLDSINNERQLTTYCLPGQLEESRERASVCSMTEEISEIKYEPQASGSSTVPTRRISYSAMHITDKVA